MQSFIIEDTHIGQTFFRLGKSILTVSSHFILLRLPRNVLKKCLLNDCPRDQSDADCLFATALLPFLEDGNVQLFYVIKMTA